MGQFLLAVSFLTILPVSRGKEPLCDDMGRSLAFFPLVGAGIGVVLWGVWWLAARVWPQGAVADVLVVTTWIVVTGALHLDGLVDTCDGVFGGGSRQERLAIMRDSRAGTFGLAGAICLLLLKFVSLCAIPPIKKGYSLIFAPTAGRWAMVFAVACFPYARPEGTGKSFAQMPCLRQLSWATSTVLALSFGLFPVRGLCAFALVAAVSWAAARLISAKLGGLTGDSYGAIAELTETLSLVLLAVPFLMTKYT